MSKASRYPKATQFILVMRLLFKMSLMALGVSLGLAASSYWQGNPMSTWDLIVGSVIGTFIGFGALVVAFISLDRERIKQLVVKRRFQVADKHAEPPIIAEFLVGLFAKRRYKKIGLLQSLEEDFKNDLAAGMSIGRARSRYWAAALNSIGPQLMAWARRWARRIGIIGLIADAARRLFP